MPEVVSISNCKGFLRAPGSKNYSVALLSVDLSRDTLTLLLDLLREICTYYSTVPNGSNDRVRSQQARCYVVARLNVLVLLSKRVCTVLTSRPDLRQYVLGAIFYVLRLALWSANRSVRCAALRCLRYYLHSASDVRLLLAVRLDLLLARCLDLSYLPEPTSSCQTALTVGRTRFQRMTISNKHSHLDSSSISATRLLMRSRRNCSPISKAVGQTICSPPANREDYDMSNPIRLSVDQGCLTSSPLVSTIAERQHFLRLVYRIVRLAPHLFPLSLIQAVAAPCLRAGRVQTTGSTNVRKGDKPVVHLAFHYRHSKPEPQNEEGAIQQDELRTVIDDFALRACLMIMCELLIISPQTLYASNAALPKLCATFRDRGDLIDNAVIPALFTTLASISVQNTIYPLRVHRAVCTALLSVINRVSTGLLIPAKRIAKFFIPFTTGLRSVDHLPGLHFDTYPSFAVSCKLYLVRMFRSWSGLFYFLHEGFSILQTLMYSLAVGSTEMRSHILDLLFALFPTLPTPHPAVKCMEAAILGLAESLLTCSSVISISEKPLRLSCPGSVGMDVEFVAAEGCRLFPRYPVPPGSTIDLLDCYTALLLTALIQAGLYEGLVRAVSDSDEHTSVRAGLLLGFLAYKAGILLPQEHPAARRLHSIGLLRSDISGSQTSVVWLERVHRVMHSQDLRLSRFGMFSVAHRSFHSPFLECLVKQAAVSSTFTYSCLQVDGEPSAPLKFQVNQSGLPSNPDQWDWDLLASFGRYLFDSHSMISWEDKSRMNFLHRIMDFITPTAEQPVRRPSDPVHVHTASSMVHPSDRSAGSTNRLSDAAPILRNLNRFRESRATAPSVRGSSKSPSSLNTIDSTLRVRLNLAWQPHTWRHSSSAAILYAGLIPHLAIYPTTSEPGRLLIRFIQTVRDALILLADQSESTYIRLFDPQQLSNSCSSLLLLALGRLTSSDAGESHLETTGLCSVMHRLLLRSGVPLLSASAEKELALLPKIILSSLDFKRPGRLGCHLLNAAVGGACESVRLYCVQLIRLLFRVRLPLVASWYIDLIVKLSMDLSPSVSQAALRLLEEVSLDKVNVEAITRHLFSESHSPATTALSADSLTPFGMRLLDYTRSGPVGHRILACIFARANLFELFFPIYNGVQGVPRPCVFVTNDNEVKDASNHHSPEHPLSKRNPVELVIKIARNHLNLSYAAEVEKRLSVHLGGPPNPEDSVDYQLSIVKSDESPTVDRFPEENEYSDWAQTRAQRERFIECLSLDSYLGDPLPYYATVPNPSLTFPLPTHLYGCLAEHSSGLERLNQCGALQDAIDTLDAFFQKDSCMNTLNTKASLWCLAHVGASSCGRTWFANQSGLLDKFYRIAIGADSMGLRATAWLCLNLLVTKTGDCCLVSHPAHGPVQWVANVATTNDTSTLSHFGAPVTTENLPGPSPLETGVRTCVIDRLPTFVGPMKDVKVDLCEPKGRGSKYFGRYSTSFSRKLFPTRLISREKHSVVPATAVSSVDHPSSLPPFSITHATTNSESLKNGPLSKFRLSSIGSSSGELESSSAANRYTDASELLNHTAMTWTHRDLISHRKDLLELTATHLPPHIAAMDAFPCPPCRGVCLPVDVRVLGYFSASVKSPVTETLNFYSASALLSFVNVASSVRSLLRRCAGECEDDNLSGRILSFCNCMQVSNSRLHEESIDRSKMNDRLEYSFPSKSRDPRQHHAVTDSSLPLIMEAHCLSRTCDQSSHRRNVPWLDPHSDHCKVTRSSHVSYWSSQLLEVVTSLLTHVSSISSARVLSRLVQIACEHRHLFSACLYTELAQLLAVYKFPLEARTIIQSAFLPMDLNELLVDAQTAVSDLEQIMQKAACMESNFPSPS